MWKITTIWLSIKKVLKLQKLPGYRLLLVITIIKLFMCTLIHTLVLSNQLLWLYWPFCGKRGNVWPCYMTVGRFWKSGGRGAIIWPNLPSYIGLTDMSKSVVGARPPPKSLTPTTLALLHDLFALWERKQAERITPFTHLLSESCQCT